MLAYIYLTWWGTPTVQLSAEEQPHVEQSIRASNPIAAGFAMANATKTVKKVRESFIMVELDGVIVMN